MNLLNAVTVQIYTRQKLSKPCVVQILAIPICDLCSWTCCKCSRKYVTLVYLSAAISMHKVRPVLYYTLGSSVGLSSSSLSVDPSSLESNKKIGRRQSQFMRDFAFGQGAQDKSSHIHTKNHSSLVLFQTKDKDRRVESSCGSEES